MGLNTNFETPKTKDFMSGGWVNNVTVVSVVPVYGGTEWQNEQYKDDVGVNVVIEIGQDFQPTFYVGGRLKKDDFGEIVGLGSVRRVAEFFNAIDVDVNMDDSMKLDETNLESCVGKEFMRLSYVSGKRDNGKLKYTDFQTVASAKSEKRDLVSIFKDHINKAWIKNYRPEVMEDSNPSIGNDELSDW